MVTHIIHQAAKSCLPNASLTESLFWLGPNINCSNLAGFYRRTQALNVMPIPCNRQNFPQVQWFFHFFNVQAIYELSGCFSPCCNLMSML